jgi:hypothetical protein
VFFSFVMFGDIARVNGHKNNKYRPRLNVGRGLFKSRNFKLLAIVIENVSVVIRRNGDKCE